MNLREIFSEEQIDMIAVAVSEKANRHKGLYKMTKNSGYGKATTLDKAEQHLQMSDDYLKLGSFIGEVST